MIGLIDGKCKNGGIRYKSPATPARGPTFNKLHEPRLSLPSAPVGVDLAISIKAQSPS